jgi:hypothetical protein
MQRNGEQKNSPFLHVPEPFQSPTPAETVILSGGGAFAAVVEGPAFSSRVYPLCFLLQKLFFPFSAQ